jgi:hypothetical protein
MAYIGRNTDKISNIEILDNITFDGSSSYSITKSSVAFTPNSAQSLLISIDGVVQATNFTVSSSTIDFGVAIPSTSTCDFFLHYGTGLITTVSDGTVTEAKIGSGAVTTAKIADANVTSAKMFSGFANGITEADQWRLTADITANTNPISSNLERVDITGFGKIGTGMSVSSGVWTFPSTGLWKIELHATGILGATDAQTIVHIRTYISASANDVANAYIGSDGDYDSASTTFLYNVTDTLTHQLTFRTSSMVSSTVRGNTDVNETHFNFIRLGDSV